MPRDLVHLVRASGGAGAPDDAFLGDVAAAVPTARMTHYLLPQFVLVDTPPPEDAPLAFGDPYTYRVSLGAPHPQFHAIQRTDAAAVLAGWWTGDPSSAFVVTGVWWADDFRTLCVAVRHFGNLWATGQGTVQGRVRYRVDPGPFNGDLNGEVAALLPFTPVAVQHGGAAPYLTAADDCDGPGGPAVRFTVAGLPTVLGGAAAAWAVRWRYRVDGGAWVAPAADGLQLLVEGAPHALVEAEAVPRLTAPYASGDGPLASGTASVPACGPGA